MLVVYHLQTWKSLQNHVLIGAQLIRLALKQQRSTASITLQTNVRDVSVGPDRISLVNHPSFSTPSPTPLKIPKSCPYFRPFLPPQHCRNARLWSKAQFHFGTRLFCCAHWSSNIGCIMIYLCLQHYWIKGQWRSGQVGPDNLSLLKFSVLVLLY